MRFSGMMNLARKILPFGESEDEEKSFGLKEMEAMKERISHAREILSDPKKTHYTMVMIPEAMSISETGRALETLKGYGIPVKSLIVNQIIPQSKNCDFCNDKRRMQLERLAFIRKNFRGYGVKEIQLLKDELRGEKLLERTAKDLYG
jgi:arsenite/tail-anchored protein-transporting ATPase